MATNKEVNEFQIKSQQSLDALVGSLVEEYEKMTGSQMALNLKETLQGLGYDLNENLATAANLTPEEKADFVAGFLQSKGQTKIADTLQLLRRITSDSQFARDYLDA
jgi:hypothetical protein